MSNVEILNRIALAISPVMNIFLICMGVILITFCILFVLQRKLWVDSKQFGIISFFYELSKFDSFCISCSYIELVLLIIYLFQFQVLKTIHYSIYLIPSIFLIFRFKNIKSFLVRLISFVIEFIGLLASNVICSYIVEIYSNSFYIVLYVLVALFIVLLGIYRFLFSFEEISNLRKMVIEH